MKSQVVAGGIRFAEGPVWCGDNTLVVTSVADGALYRIDVPTGRTEICADTGGGANGAALAADGSILVTQNGGVDFSGLGLFTTPPPFRAATPGLQHAKGDGSVVYLADEGFLAPNDLAVAADGHLVFTDSGPHPPPEVPVGRIMALKRDGTIAVVADGFHYCNGIGFTPEGLLVVVEGRGLQQVHDDGTRDWIVEELGLGGGDGFCVDVHGRFYVASTTDHGVRIVDRDGTLVDFLPIPGSGLTTNCCFGGPDMRTLFATDALPGRVIAWEGMPAPGLKLPSWPGFDLALGG